MEIREAFLGLGRRGGKGGSGGILHVVVGVIRRDHGVTSKYSQQPLTITTRLYTCRPTAAGRSSQKQTRKRAPRVSWGEKELPASSRRTSFGSRAEWNSVRRAERGSTMGKVKHL